MLDYLENEKTDAGKQVEECGWAIAETVNFSKFTSCIGLAVKTGEAALLGIHLVLVHKSGTAFSKDNANEIADFIRGKTGERDIYIFGFIDIWEKNGPKPSGGPSFYDILTAKLRDFQIHKQSSDFEDGTYSAKINGGKITVFKDLAPINFNAGCKQEGIKCLI
ncbi:MAG: hypothetical protein LBG57_07195 [Treponema sp.]|jgi:hypothetical protein|nr:hypothetical protein [Treponema sp.]